MGSWRDKESEVGGSGERKVGGRRSEVTTNCELRISNFEIIVLRLERFPLSYELSAVS